MANSACRPCSSIGSFLPSAASARSSNWPSAASSSRRQHQHLAARQQRGVELERRVLGRGADQGHRAVLDVGQEAVLLGAVEAMDLVDEQQRALAVAAALARGLEDPAQVGDAGEHRRQRLEMQVGLLGQQAGDRRLAAARRSPQDQPSRACAPPACGRAGPRGPADAPAPGSRPASWAAGVRRAASGRARRRARGRATAVSGTGRC